MPRFYSIDADCDEGEILPFSDALERHPNNNVVLFGRCSTVTSQNQGKLVRQRDRLEKAIEKAGAQLRDGVFEQEKGYLISPRPKFERALRSARKSNSIVLAEEWTRFLRAESGGINDDPTPEEWKVFWSLVNYFGITLATLMDPALTAEELHGKKTSLGMKRSGSRLGRRTELTYNKLISILRVRGQYEEVRPVGVHRIAKILKEEGLAVTSRQVQTALDLEVPDSRGGHIRLMEIDQIHLPGTALRWFLRCEKLGLIDDLLTGLADDEQNSVYRKGCTKADRPSQNSKRMWASSKG